MTASAELVDTVLGALPIVDGPSLGDLARLARTDGTRGRAAKKMLANYGARDEVVRATATAMRAGIISLKDFSLSDAVEFLAMPLSTAIDILAMRATSDEVELDWRFIDQLSWEGSMRRPWVDGRPSPWRSAARLLRAHPRAQDVIARELERMLRHQPLGAAWFAILRAAEMLGYPHAGLLSAITQLVLPSRHLELTDMGLGAIRQMVRRGARLNATEVTAIAQLLDHPLRERALEIFKDAGPLDRMGQLILRDRLLAIFEEGQQPNGRMLAHEAAVVAARVGLDDEVTCMKIAALRDELLPQHKVWIAAAWGAQRSRSPAVIETLQIFSREGRGDIRIAAKNALDAIGVRPGFVAGLVRRLRG